MNDQEKGGWGKVNEIFVLNTLRSNLQNKFNTNGNKAGFILEQLGCVESDWPWLAATYFTPN